MLPNQRRPSEAETVIQTLSLDLQTHAAQIKLLILDADGVLTDGRIFIRDNGEKIRSFNTLDGHGLKVLQASDVQIAVITGRDASSVGAHIQQLSMRYYFKGINDKRAAYAELRKQAGVEEHECAYTGNDVVDLSIMARYGPPAAIPDVHQSTLQRAAYITHRRGGCDAVHEVCDLVMRVRGTLDAALNKYIR